MTPLGFTDASPHLPEGVAAEHVGLLAVVGLPLSAPSGPTDRVRALSRLMTAGIDHVPLSPRSRVTLQQARDAARDRPAALRAALAQVSGKHQYCLGWPPRSLAAPKPKAVTGRNWLSARAAQKADAAQWMNGLSEAVALALPRGCGAAFQVTSGRLDVLLPAQLAAAWLAALTETLGDRLPADTVLTGPWPPLSFCKPQVA